MANSVHLRPRRSLTPAQELIWTSQRLQPDSPHQNMALITRFGAPVDPDRFMRSVDAVVDRSDALRTTVREVDGVPHPAVSSGVPSPCKVARVDAADLDAWMRERIAQPIDVSEAAYESVLLDHGDDVWSWFVNVHHIVIDAASSANFFRAVAAEYEGRDAEVANYGDVWTEMSTKLQGPRLDKAREHWDVLADDPKPTDLYRPDTGQSTAADRVSIDMRSGRQEALDELLADRFRLLSPDLSLTVALGTALCAYLARLGNETCTIGIPIHHRSTKDAKAVIGPLVEMFPLAVDVQDDDTFASLHDRVSRGLFDLLRYALPGTSPRQAFDVVLNIHGATLGSFGQIPANTTWIHPGHIDPHHRLRVQALDYDGSGVLDLGLDVNHRVADVDHRRRAGEHFASVLDAMAADPDRRIHAVGLVGEGERLLLSPFTSPAPGTPLDGVAPVVIAERLRANGNALTLADGGHSLDGATVDARIDAVAASLRDAGIGRGDLVGIEMPIGIDAVLAIHGVLRSGAAFVPIDPTYPDARREHIRSDSGCALVLTSLDDLDSLALGDGSGPVREEEISLDDLAYVIYTSGSTGLPKGVPITHRGLSEYLGFAHRAYVTPGVPVVMPLFTSLSFDLTITTLFLPFLSGGVMTIHPAGGLPALREIVDEGRATLLKATPSHLELLVRMLDSATELRGLIVGGEAFMTELADRLHDKLGPELAIFNEYGPTEAVVGCMEHRYGRGVDPGPEVPIGHPAPGVELHILDPHGLPVPLGVAGELYIHRSGMTSGYLGRSDLNESKLVHVPTSGSDSLLYRTGDLVRMLDADRMVYLGRIDEQIKVGGIRLEPGEIEHVARQVPGVVNSVAGLWTPDPNPRVENCVRCGLGSDVPDVTIDGDGVCSSCHQFDVVEPQAAAWFRTEDDLSAALADARARSGGKYDVLHLISGGKDSTYALHKLVELGARVFAITLDNGFISEVAKANVRRATGALGVDHEFVTVDGMNEIFRDSLERFSNVCNGCYKAIYTVALARAEELGIPAIVTGLSRGQFFETRLVPGMFDSERFDPDAIDDAVREARRVYHNTPDAVSEHMDVEFLQDGAIFDRVTFIDFYRYVDVELAEMYRALEEGGTWQRPPDTGRSTNCLINSAGIFVHKIEQGHHSYAEPYSWDVRLGHKTRDEAMFELDDPMDDEELASITSMLAAVGYEPRKPEILTLWVEATPDLDLDMLRAQLAQDLPAHSVPHAIEVVDVIPLTANGKVDNDALPAPAFRRTNTSTGDGRVAESPTEVRIASVWQSVLGLAEVRVTDDFFALGGTSLHALEMIVRVSDGFDVMVPESMAFTKRTIADLAEHVDALLEGGADALETGALVIAPLADGDRPLSDGEAALLYEWRKDPSAHRYKIGRLYTVPAGYDRERFDHAVRTVVSHQPTLHTSFGRGRPDLPLEQALRIGTARTDDGDVDALAARIHEADFDLVHGPLVTVDHLESRAAGDEGSSSILVRMHHIVSDAGSLDVFWEQVDLAYRGEPLPELGASYAAHGAWRKRKQVDIDAVWPLQSGEPLGAFVLRGERPEPDGFVSAPTAITHDQLRSGPGVTAFSNALAAFTATLAPFHDRSTFEVSVTSSVRDHPDVANVVGYFHNPLPLVVRYDGVEPVHELARRTSDLLAGSLEYRSVPFTSVVQAAKERGVAQPAARVMLAFAELAPGELDGQPVAHEVLPLGTAINDLTVFVQVRGSSLQLGIEYRGSAIGKAQATELLNRFVEVLEGLLAEPGAPVDSLQRPVAPLAGPTLTDPVRIVPNLILENIDTDPSRPAVRSGDRAHTYGELDEAARRLAGRLRALGVNPGDRIAVVLPRSVEQPAAILAIWMLGASYVPIDVSQPPSKVAELVTAAEAVAAVTSGAGHRGLGEIPTVSADVFDSSILPIRRVHEAVATDEAYVIFTSGSTGQPKGVPVSQGNLATSLAARLQWYGEPVERYLLLSSIGFDSSVAGLFWTLADGGELVIPTEAEVHDVDAVLAVIAQSEPSHLLCVPSLYDALLRRNAGALPGLQTIIVAGEACPPELSRRHHGLAPGVSLVNEYGPTEATVWATAYRCAADDAYETVPIGGPIPSVTVHIVDEAGREVPDDVVGELWIGGSTVVDGYLGEREAERFLTSAGVNSYRTGDRGIRRRSSVIEFIGRVDDQLSIGGVRVEPAEIEQAIASISGVLAVLVGARDGQLVAWIEAREGVDPAHVRSQASELLAPTHLPRFVVSVEALPRNANGKIDRQGVDELPLRVDTAPSVVAFDNDDPFVARMVELWSATFDGASVTPTDDFFAMGGDSLRAVELVSLLEDEFGRRVGIGELIDAPTPAALASRIRPDVVGSETLSTDRRSQGLVEWLRSSGEQTPLVVLPPGGGNLLRYAPLVSALDPGIPVVGIRLPGADARSEIVDTIEDQARLMLDALDTAITPGSPYRLLGWSTGGLIAWELARILVERGDVVELLAHVDTYMSGAPLEPAESIADKYRRVLDEDGARAVVEEVGGRLVERANFALARRRYRRAREHGQVPRLQDAERQLGPVIRRASIGYVPTSLDIPVVYFSATDSPPEQTVDAWVELQSTSDANNTVEVVSIDGSHFVPEERCILGSDRVHELVEALEARLVPCDDATAQERRL